MTWLDRWFWIAPLAVLLAWPMTACAQPAPRTPPTTVRPPANPASPAPTSPPTPPANGADKANRPTEVPRSGNGDIIYLPGPEGDLVPVPAGASLREYLEWLQKKSRTKPDTGAVDPVGTQGVTPPGFDITSVALDGSADDERARLTARIRVQLPRADEWARVPLNFSEAVLLGSSYKGAGESLPDRQAESGNYAWWFRGRGDHELTLELSVPVIKQLPRRRLQLSLPSTVVSSLKLRVPYADVQLSGTERGAASVRTVGIGSEIEVFGMKKVLDVAWQPATVVETGEAVLESSTVINVNLTEGEPVSVVANQRVQALQGRFSELEVTLPKDFALERIDGEEYQDHRIDPAKPQTAIVRLKHAVSTFVDLQWTLRSQMPAENVSMTISGFDVRRSRVKEGFVILQLVGDFQLDRRTREEQHVRRIRASDLPEKFRSTSATAQYRFLAQPFKLVFSLRKVEPFVTVEPVTFLGFSDDQVELQSVFSFYISRGSLLTIDLWWPLPATEKEKWSDISFGPAELVDNWEEDKKTPGLWHVHLVSPAKEACQIRMRARRTMDTPTSGPANANKPATEKLAELSPLQLVLPFSRVAGTASTLVEAFLADNVDLDLRGATGTTLKALPASLSKVPAPAEMQSLRRLSYRLENGPPKFVAGLTRHSQKILTETDAIVAASRGELSVRQRIIYDVAYGRLSHIRLKLPPALSHDRVQLLSDKGTPLAASVRRGEDASVEIVSQLDTPRSGRAEIEARYRLIAPQSRGDVAQTVSIPLLSSLDAPFSNTRFVWQDPAGREAIPAGDSWSRQPASDGLPTWIAASNVDSISVALSKPINNALRGTVISKGLLRSVVDTRGLVVTRAQYRITSLPGPLSVAFPAGVQPTSFWWNRQQVTAVNVGETQDGTIHWELPAPDRSVVKDLLLTIEYSCTSAGEQHVGRMVTLLAPTFQGETWLNSVLWEVQLPANEHLLQRPAGVSPEYRWSWNDYCFSRRSTLGPKALSDWIGEEDGPELDLAGGPNVYLFSQCGPSPEMSLRTMSQSAIVLIGAGLALAAGFVLVRLPGTRHAVSLLALVFAVAVAGLWFPEPVLLLQQPAAIGLVLAVMAAWVDSRLRRRREGRGVTLAPASGFQMPSLPGSSINRDLLPSIGTEDYTVNRPLPDESHVEPIRSSASERAI